MSPRPLYGVQIAAKIAPGGRKCLGIRATRSISRVSCPGRCTQARTAIAGEFQRHPLPDLALGCWIEQKGQIAVRVQVDKAGRNDQARRIEGVLGSVGQRPNGHDIPWLTATSARYGALPVPSMMSPLVMSKSYMDEPPCLLGCFE